MEGNRGKGDGGVFILVSMDISDDGGYCGVKEN